MVKMFGMGRARRIDFDGEDMAKVPSTDRSQNQPRPTMKKKAAGKKSAKLKVLGDKLIFFLNIL